MAKDERNWSENFEKIYKIFLESPLAKEYGASKLGLSRCLGVSQGKMQKWEAGQWPGAIDLVSMSEKFGISAHWLITGEGELSAPSTEASTTTETPYFLQKNSATRPVPMVGLASCGLGGWNNRTEISVSASPLMSTPNMLAVVAAGESMVPAGIVSGQICYCDPDVAVLEGDAVYLVRRDGKATIKLYLGLTEQEGWVRLQGWLDPDDEKAGFRRAFYIDMPAAEVITIAPVIYVRRRL